MNIAQVLKAEISRISKHEAKLLTSTTRSTAIQLKKTTADLKNRLSILEKSNKELQKQVESLVASIPKPAEEPEAKGWISGKGVKAMRKKMGVSQKELAKLTGVSTGAVVQWERQAGMLKLKDASKKAIMDIRGIGKVEARKRLDELGKTITLDKNHKNPYLKMKKLNVIAKKKALTVVRNAVKRAGLKRRK
jgi:DNA-binding transcriptional regulator YiaG